MRNASRVEELQEGIDEEVEQEGERANPVPFPCPAGLLRRTYCPHEFAW